MMGQQETTMTVATEEKRGETLIKRIMVLLTVVTLMLAMSVAPAFAQPQVDIHGCVLKPNLVVLFNASDFPSLDQKDRNGDDILCGYSNSRGGVHWTDNSH